MEKDDLCADSIQAYTLTSEGRDDSGALADFRLMGVRNHHGEEANIGGLLPWDEWIAIDGAVFSPMSHFIVFGGN